MSPSRAARSTVPVVGDGAAPGRVAGGPLVGALRLVAAVLAVTGAVKVSQTGAVAFAAVLVLPWLAVAALRRPRRSVLVSVVALGSLETALLGSAWAAATGGLQWFDAVVVTTGLCAAPVAVLLAGRCLVQP